MPNANHHPEQPRRLDYEAAVFDAIVAQQDNKPMSTTVYVKHLWDKLHEQEQNRRYIAAGDYCPEDESRQRLIIAFSILLIEHTEHEAQLAQELDRLFIDSPANPESPA